MQRFNPTTFDRGGAGGFHSFQDLMQRRVHEILLVSSIYESFILEEDGRLDEGLIAEYQDLGLVHLPRLRRVVSGTAALERVCTDKGPDLIITTAHVGDMAATEFVRRVRSLGLKTPVVLLTHDQREVELLRAGGDLEAFDKVFLWQGDVRILIAIVKYVEDRWNVESDTKLVGVQSIILLEDSVRYYSSFLPSIYAVLFEHSELVLADSVNRAHRVKRLRARPKILLCSTYEEAKDYFDRYHENVMGLISDVNFAHKDKKDPHAGVEFAAYVRARHPDIPVLLQSSDGGNRKYAEELGVSFVRKGSRRLISGLTDFMVNQLGFGDFVFRNAEGHEVARASDLRSLETVLQTVPDESIRYHGARNHFSAWLKARTEFWLAHELRPRRIEDYESITALREDLCRRLREFRLGQQRGRIVDFELSTFDYAGRLARIGGGSLGGKGRGLAFANRLIEAYGVANKYEGVRVAVPPAVVLGTDVFDRFLDENDLRDFALHSNDDEELERRFAEATFPEKPATQLHAFLESIEYPLAVRSSSILEDSRRQPFAGIYDTLLLANSEGDVAERLAVLLTAVKQVYASTFRQRAKTYVEATAHRIEEEKMAVIIQRIEGAKHEDRFYPDFSGVARSHNFYPTPPLKSEEGIASVALGLGKFVVEGGAALRFCPRHPRNLMQFATIEDTLDYSQRDFFALDLTETSEVRGDEMESGLSRHDLSVAEADGTLQHIASTYSQENDAIYDGLSRKGVRVVTFAPMLKLETFPLAAILEHLLELGRWSMNTSVEIEFAGTLGVAEGEPARFSVLQMRPMVIDQEHEKVAIEGHDPEATLCVSEQVLGNGVNQEIRDVVVVDIERFERANTRAVAAEIALYNHALMQEGRPYLLIGVGRWGSSDPWLGIPVAWEDISGAQVIVESSFRDLKVQPSQGSHFFHNLITMRVGYFTVDGGDAQPEGRIDWDWLMAQPALESKDWTRLLRFEEPLTVKMDGRSGRGVILRP